jgi:hypothetical protein
MEFVVKMEEIDNKTKKTKKRKPSSENKTNFSKKSKAAIKAEIEREECEESKTKENIESVESITTTETIDTETIQEPPSSSKPITTTKHSKLAKKDNMVIDVKMNFGAGLTQIFLQQLKTSLEQGINAEFEIRLGETMSSEKGFQAGVAPEFFRHMLSLVRSKHNETKCNEEQKNEIFWTILHYYADRVRAIQALKFDGKSKEGPCRYEKGGTLNKLDFKHVETCGLYDLRFNLKRESILSAAEIDDFFAQQWKLQSVRIKAGESFLFSALGFRIDFTEAWLGKSEDQAWKLKNGTLTHEEHQKLPPNAHTFEIEMEIVPQTTTIIDEINPRVIFQQAVQLLGQGAPGVLYLSPNL